MKTYEAKGDTDRGVHTISVIFQNGEYKGNIAYDIGGNCYGLDLLDFDIDTLDTDMIESLCINDCRLSWDEENDLYTVELKNENGNTLLCDQLEDIDLAKMVVAIEIIGYINQ